MRLAGPPPRVAPERLFRSLLPLCPMRALSCRIRCAPEVPLFAKAIPPHEEQGALDVAADAPPEIQASRAQLEILARCLWTPQGAAFHAPSDMGRLPEAEVAELAHHVAAALAEIAPTYARSDTTRWMADLERGAAHLSNISTTIALASCVSAGPQGRCSQPERFWGVPLNQLLDGHWMAFRAAQRAADALRST